MLQISKHEHVRDTKSLFKHFTRTHTKINRYYMSSHRDPILVHLRKKKYDTILQKSQHEHVRDTKTFFKHSSHLDPIHFHFRKKKKKIRIKLKRQEVKPMKYVNRYKLIVMCQVTSNNSMGRWRLDFLYAALDNYDEYTPRKKS